MNAIEVLKVAYNNPQLKDYSEESKTIKGALKEAIVALEQKEKLKEWLEKEIVAGRIKQSRAQTQGENVRQTISMTRLKALREVLERVGEQK